jgi:hypothetical protein
MDTSRFVLLHSAPAIGKRAVQAFILMLVCVLWHIVASLYMLQPWERLRPRMTAAGLYPLGLVVHRTEDRWQLHCGCRGTPHPVLSLPQPFGQIPAN